MKNFTEVIIRPLLTEKSNLMSELQNKYVFQVYKSANKIDIKTSIENRFDVKVKKVSTINYKGKNKNDFFQSNNAGRIQLIDNNSIYINESERSRLFKIECSDLSTLQNCKRKNILNINKGKIYTHTLDIIN